MKRTRIKTTKATPVASSDYKHLLAKREILQAGHERRQEEISLMTFDEPKVSKETNGNLPKGRRYYTLCWEHREYISYEMALSFHEEGIPVYWE